MKPVIFIFGCLCLVAGLVPLPIDQPVVKELRFEQVRHEKCTVVDKEM